GLLFLNARTYDPEIGRFLSPDSETPGDVLVSLNRYTYAFNDPVNHIDPSGHWPSWVNWSAVGKFATVAVVSTVVGGLCGPAAPLCAGATATLVGMAWDYGE